MEDQKKAYQIFSSFKQQYYDESDQKASFGGSNSILNMDEDIKIIIQRINKKSKKTTTTRVKALQQLQEILGQKDSVYIERFIGLFMIIYEKILMGEVDTKVLLELHKCMSIIMEKNIKEVQKNFASIFPLLFFATFEPNPDASAVSKQNLRIMLKDDAKLVKAIFIFKDKIKEVVSKIVKADEAFIKEVSVYDEKEINDIIKVKLLAMVFNYAASIFKLSNELVIEEREQVHAVLIETMCKDETDTQRIINLFNSHKQSQIIRAAIVNFFSKLFQLDYDKYLNKKQIKSVMTLFLVNNLNDDNIGAQKYYWEEGLILKLLRQSKSYGIDVLSLENQLTDLMKSSGFAAGELYYKSQSELISIILADKNKSKAIKLTTKLINTHFEAISVNEFKFDIQTHFKYGFEMIETLLKTLEDTEDKDRIGDIFVNELLLKLIELFINNNNPRQRNVLVLGINNSKHIPLYFIEYIKKCQTSDQYADILQNKLPKAIVLNLDKLLTSKMVDKDKITNYGIFASTAITYCISDQDKIVNSLFIAMFDIFLDLLTKLIETVNDVEIEQQVTLLMTLKLFFVEVFAQSNSNALRSIVVSKGQLAGVLNKFIDFITKVYVTEVQGDQLDAKLIEKSSQSSYKYIISSYIKIPYLVADYDQVLMAFSSKLQQKLIGPNSTIYDLIIFLTDAVSLQSINALISTEDLNTEIASIIDSKYWLKSDFMGKLSQSKAMEMLFASMLKYTVVYKCYLLIPVLVGYMEKDKRYSSLTLDIIYDLRTETKNLTFEGYEESIYKLLILILKYISEEDTKKFTNLMSSILDVNNYRSDDVIIQEFHQVSDKNQFSVFRHMLLLALESNIDIKFVQRFIVDVILNNSKMNTLSDIFYDFTLLCIGQLSLESIEVAEVYRKIYKKVASHIELSKILELVLVNYDENSNELLYLFSQPSIIKNLTVSKRRVFWYQVVFEHITNSILRLADTEDSKILNLYKKILSRAFENVFIQKFCFHVIRSVFKEDSIVSDSIKWSIFDLTLFTLQDGQVSAIIVLFDELYSSMQSFIKSNRIYERVTHVVSTRSPLIKAQCRIFDPSLMHSEDIEPELVEKARSVLSSVDLTAEDAASKQSVQLAILVYLQFVDLCFTKDRQDIISSQIEQLEICFAVVLKSAEQQFSTPYSQNSFIQLLFLLRKLIHIIEVFSDELQKNLLIKILHLSFHFASTFQSLKSDNFTVPPEKFVEEIAETISRFALRENSALSIDDIMALMGSDVNSLKKSCYFLLNQFKDFTQVKEDTLSRVQEEDLDINTILDEMPKQIMMVLTDDTQFDSFTYFLIWSFMLKSMTEGQNSTKLTYTIFQELFKHKKEIYTQLLYRIFNYLKQKNLNDRQVTELLTHIDFKNPETMWGETINEQTKEAFAINCLLLFSSKFPKNLRKWIEHSDKSLNNIAMLMLKQGVNRAVFELEVDQIELTQYSWKTDDFNIFIYRKSREIYAVFSQDDTCIEIALQVPENYPVNLIDVELSKEAKLPKHKTQKYVLQIKKLLTNQNFSIIEALMHWKKNIETEFSGIQPCSICYYVLHESSKKVPSRACKTCKNKFHTICIHKWFQTSNKSECPLCKSQFL